MPKNVTVFRRTILIAIMFVILFSGHTHLGLAEAPVTILKFDGTERTVTTELSDPRAVFKEAGIAVGQADRIEEKTSGRGKMLVLKRAVPVIVVRGDSQQKFFTNKDTVGEALKELNIRFNKKRVYPAADNPVTANVEIHILNKGDTLSSVEADSEIPVKYIDDENIPYGQEQLVEQGKAGKVKVVKKSVVSTGKAPKEVEIAREVLADPKYSVIRRGIGMSVETPEGRKKYSRIITAEASAYTVHCGTGTGLTSIGLVAARGIVAVDPRVIPYYTKMYIPGYGIAIAGDTGGSIRGNRVDLFMDSYEEAINWGRRNVEVYILED